MTLSEYGEALRGKRTAVLGMGVSNRPLVRFLLDHGALVTVRDKTPFEKLGEEAREFSLRGAEFVCGDGYLTGLSGDVIFRSPGIRPDLPEICAALEAGAVLTSEMEAFFAVCPCHILGVTGSDGKTTTTTITSLLLREAGYRVFTGGNIGTPLLCRAEEMGPEDWAVLELSSFQLMTMDRSPEIALVTNLSPNHLDVHKGMEEYVRAKKNLFLHQKPGDLLVLNGDNDVTAGFCGEEKGRLRLFSRREKVSDGFIARDGKICRCTNGREEYLMDTGEVRLPGVHNVENYLAAFSAVADLVPPEIMVRVAKTFGGVEHRMELVRELRGVRFYNDSIASSPSRTIAGLRCFPERVVLIAGGKDKGVPFDTLAEEALTRVRELVLTGFTAEKIRQAVLEAPGYRGMPRVTVVEDFTEAVKTAAGLARPGEAVLLSPACTSFDRFKNFEERGKLFKKIIMELE